MIMRLVFSFCLRAPFCIILRSYYTLFGAGFKGINYTFGTMGVVVAIEAFKTSISSLPGLNFTTFLALTSTLTPVLGFLAVLAGLSLGVKVPRPVNDTLFPDFKVS